MMSLGDPQVLFDRLAALLLVPVDRLPGRPLQHGAVVVLNQVFAAALANGDLDFIIGRRVRIQVEAAGVELGFFHDGQQLHLSRSHETADLSIRGASHDFLLLITQREDPDTLFFHRRLKIEGDVELGLALKNFLACWEPPRNLEKLLAVARHAVDWIEDSRADVRNAAVTAEMDSQPRYRPGHTSNHRRLRQ